MVGMRRVETTRLTRLDERGILHLTMDHDHDCGHAHEHGPIRGYGHGRDDCGGLSLQV